MKLRVRVWKLLRYFSSVIPFAFIYYLMIFKLFLKISTLIALYPDHGLPNQKQNARMY